MARLAKASTALARAAGRPSCAPRLLSRLCSPGLWPGDNARREAVLADLVESREAERVADRV